jgi:penicillin-binding protein 1C
MLLRDPHRSIRTEVPVPRGFVSASICPLSGRLAGPECPETKAEIFAPGTEPTQRCPFHTRVRIDRRNGLRAGSMCPAKWVVNRPLLALPQIYESWARKEHLELAPLQTSPLCPDPSELQAPAISIQEPRDRARFLWDPDTPPESSGIRLSARVTPGSEEIIWIVDGQPMAKVGYPHETRVNLTPGSHTIRAAMAQSDVTSAPVTISIEN